EKATDPIEQKAGQTQAVEEGLSALLPFLHIGRGKAKPAGTPRPLPTEPPVPRGWETNPTSPSQQAGVPAQRALPTSQDRIIPDDWGGGGGGPDGAMPPETDTGWGGRWRGPGQPEPDPLDSIPPAPTPPTGGGGGGNPLLGAIGPGAGAPPAKRRFDIGEER